MFLNSGVWENIQTEILSITNDNSISFVEFDVANDDPNLISKVLMIVPSIYIKTPEGVFFYQDNIYNSKNMIQVLKSLLQKFNFLEE